MEAPKPKAKEEEIAPAEKQAAEALETIDVLCAKLDDFKNRLFQGNNYKKRLPKDAPGKRELNQLKAQVRKLERPIKTILKKHRPPAERKKTDSKRSGFNRLCFVSKEMTQVLQLGDYGLISEDGIRGIATPGTVTRLIVNRIYFMMLPNPKQMSYWKADETMEKLFEHEWDTTGVDKNKVTYTGLQKLISPHLKTVEKEQVERRDENLCNGYYKVLDTENGELGKPSYDALKGRKNLDEIKKSIVAMDKQVRACRKQGISKIDTEDYETAVRTAQKKWADRAELVKKICAENGFPISENWPTPIDTCLDA